MTPAITVLMSVHNGLPFVAEAVRTVLAQSITDFEFLIIDDASTDGTRDFLRTLNDPRVRIIELPENIGLTAALNRGLREARGEFIARQDADDLSRSRRFELQLAHLKADADCVVVGSQAWLSDETNRSLGKKNLPLTHHGIRFAHLFDNALIHAATMFRRSAILDAGGYNEEWVSSQDYELWSRLAERHKVANLPQRLVTVRLLKTGITLTHKRGDLIRRVQATHFERLTGEPPNDSDLDLIALFRRRVVPERLREFRALLDELTACYERAHPGETQAGDFRRARALIHERIGYNLLTMSRRSGLGEILRATKVWPPSLFAIPWWRVAGLCAFGDSARRIYERARR